jgi:ribosomal protein S27E
MRWNQIINEASDFNCANCGDYMGKDTEVSNPAYCGVCGHTSANPRGGRPAQIQKQNTNGVEFVTTRDDGYTHILVKRDDKNLGYLQQFGQAFLAFNDFKWEVTVFRGTQTATAEFSQQNKDAAIEWILQQHS